MYNLRVYKEEESMPVRKKSELILKDLRQVMPTLFKHKIDSEVKTHIRKLRDGRKKKHYTLELTRKFIDYSKSETTLGQVSLCIYESMYGAVNRGPRKMVDGFVVARKITSQEFKSSAPLTKEVLNTPQEKAKLLKKLKNEITDKIKEIRKANKPILETITLKYGYTTTKMADVYTEAGSFIKALNYKVRHDMIHTAKKPTTKDNYVGIELEFGSKLDRETIADHLFEAGWGKYVYIKSDSSIGSSEGRPTGLLDEYPNQIEINVLVKEGEHRAVVEGICNVLNEKCQIKVDKSCGLHVHVDMRQRDPKLPFSNLVSTQHFLYAMCPSNRKTGRYSVPVQERSWHETTGHYAGVSSEAYARHKTLELRMHCGTTQSRKINNWIDIILAIVNAPIISEYPLSTSDLQIATGMDFKLKKYMESRIAKFEGQHKKKVAALEWMKQVAAVSEPADNDEQEQSEVA